MHNPSMIYGYARVSSNGQDLAQQLAQLDAAIASARAAIVGASLGANYRDVVGLSVFAPSSREGFAMNRRDYEALRFAGLTGWYAVLAKFYA